MSDDRGHYPAKPKRRALRIALVSLASVFALVAAAAVGGVLVLNHLASGIRHVPVAFAKLAVAGQPVGGHRGGRSMTVLIIGAGVGPAGSPTARPGGSGLIMLLHINADRQAGVVSIPPQSVVPVPGHGDIQIQKAMAFGGPSLLVRTVEQLTHVQIQHYARIDFSHAAHMVGAMGGVDAFPQATNRLLVNPVTTYDVLSALTAMLTVDSTFTNSELVALASELRGLSGRAGTFIAAPAHTVAGQVFLNRRIGSQLWQAIRQDSIAGFAQKYPSTVTPEQVP